MNRTIVCVVGTRPEAIKMAPVILALRREPWVTLRVLATAQHRELLDKVLQFFDIQPDMDLDIMRPSQSLGGLTARLLLAAEDALARMAPDAVLVQGDTTTVMSVALASFYAGIPIGHVEAGLRTGDMRNPFPEEANRVITARLARWHFAPTPSAADNLRREGISDADVHVTGNTVIDALTMTAARDVPIGYEIPPGRMVLVTMHRRENFGAPVRAICEALRTLARRNPDVQWLFPVHPNPNVKPVAHEVLGGEVNVLLCEPLDYAPFISAMKRAHLIISDSGGVQEEAPALGKPVLVMREETERPEAVEQGVVRLVGTDAERLQAETQRLLDDPKAYAAMAKGVSPYGDGQASQRIVSLMRQALLRPGA